MDDPLIPETGSPPKSKFRNPLLYSSLALVCVALYVVYVLFARYESNKLYLQQTKARQDAQRHEADLQTVEQLGGSELAIRGFYVTPALIRPGQSAQLCYDVANAKTVTLDPPVGTVWPSHSRCIDVSPKKTTTYTLTIAGTDGKTISQSVELHVR